MKEEQVKNTELESTEIEGVNVDQTTDNKVEKQEEDLIIHPLLIIAKDNFEFNPPIMDAIFYGALHRLFLKINEVIKEPDQELSTLMNIYKHFLISTVQKCVEDGHVEPVTNEQLIKIAEDYTIKVQKMINDIKKEEK